MGSWTCVGQSGLQLADTLEIKRLPTRVTILIVSDYEAGKEKSWNDLRRALRAWRAQLDGIPAASVLSLEWRLLESCRYAAEVPDDLFEILPDLQLLSVDVESFYELKNAGVEATQTDWVALVDADCVPAPHWLSRLEAAIRADPELAAVSGITTYPGRHRLERILGLLSRSYADPGLTGPGRFISGNAAAYRRSCYLSYPLPVDLGPFAGRLQSEAMRRAGLRFHVDTDMITVHDFEGWSMERDIRRQQGYATVITRIQDSRMPQAGLIRLGPLAIPAIVLGKTLLTLSDALRCHRHHGVSRAELPFALLLCPLLQLLEVSGMLSAYTGQPLSATAYR